MKRIDIAVLVAYISLAGTLGMSIYRDEVKKQEFVCLTHDKLTERHVGVKSAEPYGLIRWKINYVDGPSKFYLQRSGESCGVEEL